MSEDIELAEAFVAHGDVLVASGEKKRAIESYSQAEVIFFNHYKKNIANLYATTIFFAVVRHISLPVWR